MLGHEASAIVALEDSLGEGDMYVPGKATMEVLAWAVTDIMTPADTQRAAMAIACVF